MADSASPALPEAGQRAAEALLTRALGEPAVAAPAVTALPGYQAKKLLPR